MKTIEFCSIVLLAIVVLCQPVSASMSSLNDIAKQLKDIDESIDELNEQMKNLAEELSNINGTIDKTTDNLAVPIKTAMLSIVMEMNKVDNTLQNIEKVFDLEQIKLLIYISVAEMLILITMLVLLIVNLTLKLKKK